MPEPGASELRWGIIGCGLISSWFVSDLVLERDQSSTKHIIQAIGSSSVEKATAFVAKNCPSSSPRLYSTYDGVYNDPDVDIVYIGTPHALHFQNALAAIDAGKNVLCEKPFTINAKQTEKLIEAARRKGVFLMEAVWTRFFPIVGALQKLLYEDKAIGQISRIFVDFGLEMPISSLPKDARTADPALGAGALLDIGIYSLTWASIILDMQAPRSALSYTEDLKIASSMSFINSVDEITSIILNYPAVNVQAICTASMLYKTDEEFCRIEGSQGSIVIGGKAASRPDYLIVKIKNKPDERIDFDIKGWGFIYEQDAVAEDIKSGRKESLVMPLEKSEQMMSLMDSIRKTNGLVYKADLE